MYIISMYMCIRDTLTCNYNFLKNQSKQPENNKFTRNIK